MVTIKSKAFSYRVPTLSFKGSELKPDLLFAIKDGKVKVSCLEEEANLSQIIHQVRDLLDLLEDLRWASIKANCKKKSS